jgi:hypothetical protein
VPYYGLLRKAKFRHRRGPTHEARPCWFKGKVLEFLEKPEYEQANLLELPSERVARTSVDTQIQQLVDTAKPAIS